MEDIQLKGPAVIDGAVRYPTEGVLTVSDEEAARQHENHNVVGDADPEPADDSDGLDELTLPDLGTLVTKEGVPLNGATKKADIVAAIRAHRAPAA